LHINDLYYLKKIICKGEEKIYEQYTDCLLFTVQKHRKFGVGNSSPDWFKTIAPPVLSFLRHHDFTGKTIIPFCTHGGGGFGQIEEDIAKECPNSIMLPGFSANGTVTPAEVKNWLKTIGY